MNDVTFARTVRTTVKCMCVKHTVYLCVTGVYCAESKSRYDLRLFTRCHRPCQSLALLLHGHAASFTQLASEHRSVYVPLKLFLIGYV